MSILVTGAAGFIGSHLCDRLARDGARVWGLDNFGSCSAAWPGARQGGLWAGPEVPLDRCDVRNPDDLDEFVGRMRPDAIVHLAALAGVRASISEPRSFVDTNVGGTLNVLESARRHDVGHVVLASTSSVYGRAVAVPFVEDDPAICPGQPYAVTKRSAEMMARAYHDLHGLQCTVLRLFTVYGPRGRPDMMPYKLVESVATGRPVPFFGSELRRDWTYVADIVDGIVAASERPLGFEVLNLGRGRPVSLGDFVRAVEEISGRTARLRHEPPPASEMPVTHADITRARRRIGYDPVVDVTDGVAALWRWFVTHRCTTD